jgi:hypothetical protein
MSECHKTKWASMTLKVTKQNYHLQAIYYFNIENGFFSVLVQASVFVETSVFVTITRKVNSLLQNLSIFRKLQIIIFYSMAHRRNCSQI